MQANPNVLFWIILYALTTGCGSGPPTPADPNGHVQRAVDRLIAFGYQAMRDTAIVIDVERQQLVLLLPGGGRRAYPVSTSKTGVAIESEASTFRTPVGVMYIAEKVGSGNPPGTRFVNRKSTGIERIHTAPLRGVVPEDQIMTRILWLDGMEWGVNKGLNRFGASVDAKERSIYIHGTNNEFTIGEPASQGCIRMRNKDVLELFEMIEVGTLVYIG